MYIYVYKGRHFNNLIQFYITPLSKVNLGFVSDYVYKLHHVKNSKFVRLFICHL
jgi:hypothetical protein